MSTNSTNASEPPRQPNGRPTNSGLVDVKVKIDWFRQQNTSRHHTYEYENEVLVVRRGGKINLGMTFEGIKFSEITETALRFSIEPKPKGFEKSLYIHCGIQDNMDDLKWGMKVVEKDSSKLQILVEVNIPVNTAVGKYSMDVVAGFSSKPLQQSHIIILFNPWNKDDEVYLDDEELRNEYVLNDTGLIFRGSGENNYEGKAWNYGQFEKNILDCVLLLLEKDKRARKYPLKALSKRNSPVLVARILSAVLNVQDDQGVLVGNWSGYYEDGIAPYKWSGSVKILQTYFKSERPVEYGQCWVFSGIMTTALRALGIPARSITNFASAHDKDNTMTIDRMYNENGDLLDISYDSIWNFHVWNEIWTKRKDLPQGYDGWQAVDSTPQEKSSQLYQLGPAPLKAVKNGEIYAGFDTGFVFSEVNADVVNWVIKENEYDFTFQVSSRTTRLVGEFISTKQVGGEGREDITHLYKHPEGSPEERKAFQRAYSFGRGPENWVGHLNVEEEGEDLTIDLSTTPNGVIPKGDSFTCKIDVKNTSKEKVTVNLTGVLSSVQYTGEVKVLVKRQRFDEIQLGAGKKVTHEIHVNADEYLNKLTDLNCLKLVVVAKVLETGKQYVDEFPFQLSNKDCIEVKFLEPPLKVGQQSKVAITFTNCLPVPLNDITFSIEGAGLTTSLEKNYSGELGCGQKGTVEFSFQPRIPGVRTLLVDIDSYQAKDFTKYAKVNVVKVITDDNGCCD